MLLKEVIAVYSENHTEPINTNIRVNCSLKQLVHSYHLALKGKLPM
jgi:hypothetical protein